MAAKILHSLTDDNPDLQKQIGCMTGIFQLFDRQHVITGGRCIVGPSPKRLPPGNSQFSSASMEGESSNANSRSSSLEKYSHKYMQDRQRISTESSRASFSSSSRSSSFSSIDCNRAPQIEPALYDRIIFPETPSRDPGMSLQSSSPQFSRQSLDLRDLVKDSMYREVQGLSSKAKSVEEAKDSIGKYRDSPRLQSRSGDSSCGSTHDTKQSVPADLKESLRVLSKLQEAPRYHNEPRELLRSSSYHAREGSSFSVPKDAPRFSYDGRETNRSPFDSRDFSKSALKLKDLPRLSLDSREGSTPSLNADSKSKSFSKTMQKDCEEIDGKIQNLQQARPPSVVAKLMGLETLPDSVSSSDPNTGSSRSFPDDDFVSISKSFAKSESRKPTQQQSFSKNMWKEPSSPRWRNPDSSMKPMSRFPIEPAPWKQIEGTRSSHKAASLSTGRPTKAQNNFSSVYSEIEKRLKDLKFTQSGKDLRALKQILEAMQVKGLLETEKEGQGSNFASHEDHDRQHLSSMHDTRSVNNRKLQTSHVLASTRRRVSSTRNYESPIVIMKPAKLVEKSGISAASVISLDGLSGVPEIQGSEFVDSRKNLNGDRPTKVLVSKTSQRENAASSVSMNSDRTLKATQTSTRSQQLAKDSNVGSMKSSGAISPRLQQKKLDLEKRSRPPTPPDSSKQRRQPNKQQAESTSPGGRRRPKNLKPQQSHDQQNEINVESRNFSHHVNENSVQPHDNSNRGAKMAEVSPGLSSSRNPSKASKYAAPGLAEKKSLALSEQETAEFACVPPEYSSPVSVLDNVVYKDESPSPVKYTWKTLKGDVSMDTGTNSNAVESSSVDTFVSNPIISGPSSEMNRKKLQNIDNLVQKLRRLNSSHDEAHTDYIASLSENTHPDHRYISEILLASGLLLRDLGSSPTNFQFHPSGHPINPELFLVLEQTKASTLLKGNSGKTSQIVLKEKSHRKLVFDAVNEILARKLASSGPLAESWLRPFKHKRAMNAQKILRELCSGIEELQAKNSNCSSDEEDERWKNIMCKDMLHHSGNWINFDEEVSDAVLDIERLIFKDLVNEVVIGESAGAIVKPGRRRQLFSK